MKPDTSLAVRAKAMVFAVIALIAPRVAGRIATKMWFTPAAMGNPWKGQPPIGSVPLAIPWRETTIEGFTLGHGTRTALLVHGWAGSPNQFSRLAHRLSTLDFTVTAMELPGHGVHSGDQTDPVEIADAVLAVGRSLGHLDVVVAHSFGALTAVIAMDEGFRPDTFVAIAPGVVPRKVLDSFISALRIPDRTVVHLEAGISKRLGEGAMDRISTAIFSVQLPEKILIIHDADDAVISIEQSIELSKRWNVPLHTTSGLGHNRVLSATEVVDLVVETASVDAE